MSETGKINTKASHKLTRMGHSNSLGTNQELSRLPLELSRQRSTYMPSSSNPTGQGLLRGCTFCCTSWLLQEGYVAESERGCLVPPASSWWLPQQLELKLRAQSIPGVEYQMCWIQLEARDQGHSSLLAAASRAMQSFQRDPADRRDR